jgi:hypothetical protein
VSVGGGAVVFVEFVGVNDPSATVSEFDLLLC